MPHWGLGAMIDWLSGYDSDKEALEKAIGQEISSVRVENDIIKIDFKVGFGIEILDNGQSCCEHRYMVVDDKDFDYFVGAKFTGIAVGEYLSNNDDYNCHDSQFLYIRTDIGTFDAVMHDEHNGYYAGFSPRIRIAGLPWDSYS